MLVHRRVAISVFLAGASCAPEEVMFEELAFPGRSGEIRRAVFDTAWGPTEMSYELIDGVAVVGGDIIMRLPDVPGDFGSTARHLGPQAAPRTDGGARWPHGYVPYDIDATVANPSYVNEAIAAWEAKTSIQFTERTIETDYVTFRAGTGCSSGGIGRDRGQQFVNVASCAVGNIKHEIGHVLGLWHEQSRTDRDDHIIINSANIDPDYADNFETYVEMGEDGKNFGPYETDSIMHYSSYAFALDPWVPTITQLDGTDVPYQRNDPTDIDACAVERFHGFGRSSDVNGDGYADLVVGAPNEDDVFANAGAINVIYGGESGLGVASALINRDTTGVNDSEGAGDQFGFSVAVGDFNGDCLADVAVGVPYDDVNGIGDAGSVHVFYGSFLIGLGTADDEIWHEEVSGIPGIATAGDRYGYTLATGDFNGDGYSDLAVGDPFEDVGAITDAGVVNIIYGGASGLTATGSQIWHQDIGLIQDSSSSGEQFGFALAAGDFDGDGFEDLAVGVPYEEVDGNAGAGTVHIIDGSIDGLTDAGNQMWNESNGAIAGIPELNDLFGFALAAGYFDGDGSKDLAIGVPLEDVGSTLDAGKVTVLYSGPGGLTTDVSDEWVQGGLLADAVEVGDVFGRALVAEDFDGDGFDDLAVAAPYEDVGAINSAGAVSIIHGAARGLTDAGNKIWYQDVSMIEDDSEASDHFGFRLAAGDFDGSGYADLAIGIPEEDVGAVSDAGAIQVLYSAGVYGLSALDDDWLHQNSPAILDTAETSDSFGLGL